MRVRLVPAKYHIWDPSENTEWSEDVNSVSPGDMIDYINEGQEALMDPFCEVCSEIMKNTCDNCGKYYCEICDEGNACENCGEYCCENCDVWGNNYELWGEYYCENCHNGIYHEYNDEAWPYK